MANGPIVCLTKLGYVVYGPTGSLESATTSADVFLTHTTSCDEDLQTLVKRYFCTEDFRVKVLPLIESNEVVRAKEMLRSTTKHVGKLYESGLLWKVDNPRLPNNFQMALKRLESGEKKMKRDTSYRDAYHNAMSDYFFERIRQGTKCL